MAANDFIMISRSATTQAQQFANVRDSLEQAGNGVVRMFAVMQHMTDGVTYTAMEGMLGLPVGTGATVYSAMQQVAILFTSPDPNIDKIVNRTR